MSSLTHTPISPITKIRDEGGVGPVRAREANGRTSLRVTLLPGAGGGVARADGRGHPWG